MSTKPGGHNSAVLALGVVSVCLGALGCFPALVFLDLVLDGHGTGHMEVVPGFVAFALGVTGSVCGVIALGLLWEVRGTASRGDKAAALSGASVSVLALLLTLYGFYALYHYSGPELDPERADLAMPHHFPDNSWDTPFGPDKAKSLDPETERIVAETGCDNRYARACRRLGVMLATGVGGAKDQERAQQFFEKAEAIRAKACEAGNREACGEIPPDLEVPYKGNDPDTHFAYEISAKGCALGYPEDCRWLGMLVLDDGQPGKAQEYFLKGCELGDLKSCGRVRKHPVPKESN